MAVDDVSSFCCGPGYNSTTESCQYVTRGSTSPFQVPNGKVVLNRDTGSTGPNVTTTTTATVTVTAKATNGLEAPLQRGCANHDAAIAGGIGVPLGLLLLLLVSPLQILGRSGAGVSRHVSLTMACGLAHDCESQCTPRLRLLTLLLPSSCLSLTFFLPSSHFIPTCSGACSDETSGRSVNVADATAEGTRKAAPGKSLVREASSRQRHDATRECLEA